MMIYIFVVLLCVKVPSFVAEPAIDPTGVYGTDGRQVKVESHGDWLVMRDALHVGQGQLIGDWVKIDWYSMSNPRFRYEGIYQIHRDVIIGSYRQVTPEGESVEYYLWTRTSYLRRKS